MTPRSIVPVADRLARILPRLGSDFDGEVVASARAIGRVLQSAGLDFHDLTASLVSNRTHKKPFERAGQDTPPLWSELNSLDRERWLVAINGKFWLSDWEAKFAEDILRQFRYSRIPVS